MKKLATITGDHGEAIAILFDATTGHLYTECFGEPTTEVGPHFDGEGAAAEYVQDSWNTWGLTWAAAGEIEEIAR